MANLLYVVGAHDELRRLLPTINVAAASLRRGDRVVLLLQGNGVYLTDPVSFLPYKRTMNGYRPPLEMVAELARGGAEFWLNKTDLEHLGLSASPGHKVVDADAIAESLPSFDSIVTF